MLNINLNMLGSDAADVSVTLQSIQYNSFEDCSSSSDNEDESFEEDIIVGLSNFRFEDRREDKYISKSPHLNSPNRKNSPSQQDSLCELVLDGIPILPELNVLRASNGEAKTNDSLPTPRLLVHNQSKREITPVLTSVYLAIHPKLKTFGFQLKRTGISEKTAHHSDSLQFLFQPDPHLRRVVHCEVQIEKVAKENGNEGIELQDQFVAVQPFVYKNLTTIEALLEGVPEHEVESAIKLIASHDAETIFKSYGPNNDSLLMTLCCKRDDTFANRARVYALVSRVLRETDQGLRKNISSKNLSGLTALDYTTVTNNAIFSVFLAEMFYLLGQDVLCMDGSGNTLLHIMARKGDAVSHTLDALLSITYRSDPQKFVFNSNVANSKGLLPLHIASMSPTCPNETLTVLINNNPSNISAKTKDGSLPIHLACQYSSDPGLLDRLLTADSTVINDAREDGLTPIHLVASRNDDQEAKIGLMPLPEDKQVEMLSKLLSFGANKNSRVEDYLPIQLVRQGRSQAKSLLATDLENMNEFRPFDASPPHIMTHPTPPLVLEGFSRPGSFATVDSDFSERNQFASSETDDSEAPVHLDAIAHALIGHPTIQAVIDAAAEENNFDPNNDI